MPTNIILYIYPTVGSTERQVFEFYYRFRVQYNSIYRGSRVEVAGDALYTIICEPVYNNNSGGILCFLLDIYCVYIRMNLTVRPPKFHQLGPQPSRVFFLCRYAIMVYAVSILWP